MKRHLHQLLPLLRKEVRSPPQLPLPTTRQRRRKSAESVRRRRSEKRNESAKKRRQLQLQPASQRPLLQSQLLPKMMEKRSGRRRRSAGRKRSVGVARRRKSDGSRRRIKGARRKRQRQQPRLRPRPRKRPRPCHRMMASRMVRQRPLGPCQKAQPPDLTRLPSAPRRCWHSSGPRTDGRGPQGGSPPKLPPRSPPRSSPLHPPMSQRRWSSLRELAGKRRRTCSKLVALLLEHRHHHHRLRTTEASMAHW
mmetsp:Transcript_40555/g.94168  ORF Transcript_40555/g.94168 Transcript_40555/m.94168 type:complete len:251 (+) Transcript_40555:529-1281(+)